MGHFAVNDQRLYGLFEVINELRVPVMIDVGTTGMGAGMPGGMGSRLRHAHPSAIDDLAADFPNLTIIAAHPGWPWVDEMTAVALHKGNVFWEAVRVGAKIFSATIEAGYSWSPKRQNHFRERLPEHSIRPSAAGMGRARLLR